MGTGHEAPNLTESREVPIVAGIEGRLVSSDAGNWVARVHGVHGDDRWWWIQVASAGDASASVIVRCSHHAKPDHVAAALRTWQPSTTFTMLVMTVMA